MRPSLHPVPLGACLALGAVGLLVLGVQPLLYGAFVGEGLVSEARLGLLAALEILSIALGSVAGLALLARAPVRVTAIIGIGVTCLANWLSVKDGGGPMLFGMRAVAGLGGGMLVAVAAAAIANTRAVNTAAAAFLFLQAISQWAVLKWSEWQLSTASSLQVQHELVVAALISLLLLLAVPSRLASEEARADDVLATGPTPRGLFALLGAGLCLGGIVGIWAYLGLWLSTRGLGIMAITPLLSASLAGQMLGALAAMGIGEHGDSRHRLIGLLVVLLAIVATLVMRGPGGTTGWILIIAFGFMWMAATPALSGFILASDPGRGSLPYAASAQLLGAAIIPTIAGEAFAADSMDHVVMFCAAIIVASLVTIVLIRAPRSSG